MDAFTTALTIAAGSAVLIMILPFHLCWRVAGILLCGLIFWLRLTPPSPPSDHDWAIIGVVIPVAIFFILIGIRLAIGLFLTLRYPNIAASAFKVPVLVDVAIAIWISGILTLESFVQLSWYTIDFAYPVALHIALLFVGLFLLTAFLSVTGRFMRVVFFGTGLSLLVLTSVSYFYFPSLVLHAAVKAAEGKPYCIRTRSHTDVEQRTDLTFLTISKAPDVHFSLATADGWVEWSFYQRRFDPESKRLWNGLSDSAYARWVAPIPNCYNLLMQNLK